MWLYVTFFLGWNSLPVLNTRVKLAFGWVSFRFLRVTTQRCLTRDQSEFTPRWVLPQGENVRVTFPHRQENITFLACTLLPLGEYYNIQWRNPTFSFLLFRLSNRLSNIVQCSRIIAIGMALNQMHDRIFKLVTHPSKLH